MAQDLPIYPESPMLRTGMQFADLQRWSNLDNTPIWEKSDEYIAGLEAALSVSQARAVLEEPDKAGLLSAHRLLFAGTPGAGRLRSSVISGPYRGQDCPEPEHIDRSLNNFFMWMSAESMAEVHPIERAALVFTRVMDIWPFDSGNLTMAIMLTNAYLKRDRLPPFFILPQHRSEFETIVGKAIAIETQPLVNAIYATLRRELEAIAG